MRKLLFLFIVLGLAYAVDITATAKFPDGTPKQVRIESEIDSGFYGDDQGKIMLEIRDIAPNATYIEVFAKAERLVYDQYALGDSELQWQIYYASDPTNLSSAGLSGVWVPYRRGQTPLFRKNYSTIPHSGALDVELGTLLHRVPSVQPNGLYKTNIEFEIVEY